MHQILMTKINFSVLKRLQMVVCLPEAFNRLNQFDATDIHLFNRFGTMKQIEEIDFITSYWCWFNIVDSTLLSSARKRTKLLPKFYASKPLVLLFDPKRRRCTVAFSINYPLLQPVRLTAGEFGELMLENTGRSISLQITSLVCAVLAMRFKFEPITIDNYQYSFIFWIFHLITWFLRMAPFTQRPIYLQLSKLWF